MVVAVAGSMDGTGGDKDKEAGEGWSEGAGVCGMHGEVGDVGGLGGEAGDGPMGVRGPPEDILDLD